MTRFPLPPRLQKWSVAVVASGLLAGCSFSPHDLPLPGGPDVGDDAFTVTAEFDDVLDLVPRSSVKLADVTVGEVERIWLNGFTAKVSMRIDPAVDLPDNATARIRQTSLLGEKFVSLSDPGSSQQSYGRLGEGDTIPLARTGHSVEVEQVLSTLAALLTGGGLAQLETIEEELNHALAGREQSVTQVLRRLDRVLGELDTHKRDITRAIESLDRLTADLRRQRKQLATAVDEIPEALTVLADQRRNLTKLLTGMSRLGKVGTRVIEGSREDLLANLRELDPILTELAAAGDNLPKSFQLLFTYPFTDATARGVRGDYTNLQLTLDANLQDLLDGTEPLPIPTELPVPTELPIPTLGPKPTREPTSLPTGLPTGLPTTDPVPSPTAGDDSRLCLPMLCPEGAGTRGSAQPSTYDPELAQLLIGGALQ